MSQARLSQMPYLVPLILSSTEWQECDLLGNDPFTWIVQVILGTLAFSTLIVKKFVDKSVRTWHIWFFDVSKQLVSNVSLHFFNIWYSYIIVHHSRLKNPNPCVWYFLQLTVDVFVGTFLCYLFLSGIEKLSESNPTYKFKCGYYGRNPRISQWIYQSLIWVAIVFMSKLNLIGIMLLFDKQLNIIGQILLGPFMNYPKVMLVMVMIIFPLFLNAFMFWITDMILVSKKKTQKKQFLDKKSFPLIPKGKKFQSFDA